MRCHHKNRRRLDKKAAGLGNSSALITFDYILYGYYPRGAECDAK
jgi:hypothetical protein